jgi:hypothetical protein
MEVRSQKGHLKKIEDLGAAMEERLILDNRYEHHLLITCILSDLKLNLAGTK